MPEMKRIFALFIIAMMGVFSMTTHAGTTDNNRADILKKYYEVADQRPFHPEKLRSFYAEKLVDHNAHDPDIDPKDSAVGTFASLAIGAPDSSHDIQILESAGKDLVVVYWRFSGTHTGELLGIPATNKPFDFAGMEIYKITEGKISDIWHIEDITTMMAQLGLADH
ncbi:ester cyclase [Endozoicomonadaceae bacterium StTr2]